MREQIEAKVEILLVDDREDGLLALEALLQSDKRYKLIRANSGQEAIKLVEKNDIGVILMDVQMPGLDGFQTVEKIRRNPRNAEIPILFVTAINKDDRYVYRGYEAGAVDYIFKPFDPMILRSKVSVFATLHLQKRKIRDQTQELRQRDAAEHRLLIQAMELETLRRYESLADAIPHILMRCSIAGSLDYHNDKWTEYTGLSSKDSAGTGWQTAVEPEDLSIILKEWTGALLARMPFEAECRLRRRDGIYRWHWIKAIPQCDDANCVTSWLATCTDIHDRKLAEQNLKEAQTLAQAASAAKTQFLANMSHEIRTPLSAIMGFTELLLDPLVPIEEKMKGASIILRSGNLLMKTVDEILDISKVESGRLEIERVHTNFVDMLKEILTLMEISANKKCIQLDFEFGTRIPKTVITDSTRVRQILMNVIGNAVKFTEKGKVRVVAHFDQIEFGASYLRIDVTDTGLGIAPDQREKIFQPFSQADSSTTRLYGGTGLGLPLARRLARALEGDVVISSSQPQQGTSFEIKIRVDLPTPVEWVDTVSSENENARDNDASSQIQDLKGRRILLVEDAEEIQLLVMQYLSRTGAKVDIASNGLEGVKKALAGEFDVVLMDIQMPLVDGYQATRQLREAGYDRPIFAMTAHAMVDEREKSFRTGCTGHLTKPISRQTLIESLVKAVRMIPKSSDVVAH